jgi:hypothetical protein
MPLTSEQVRLIQERDPGWENAWAELALALLGDDGRSGVLCQAIPHLGISWPNDATRDDFVAWMMLKFQEKANKGTLLAGYFSERGTPEDYLTSRTTLRHKALAFLSHSSVRQAAKELLEQDTLAQWPAPGNDPNFTALLAEVGRRLERLSLRTEGRITAVLEQAGLQLHPRLNWEQQVLARLRDHLANVIRNPDEAPNPFAVLAQVHDEERQYWRIAAEELNAKFFNKGKFCSLAKQRQLENRWIELLFHQVFMPLRSEAVAKLLGITTATAHMRRFHYRRRLPDLLPSLAQYYSIFRDLRDDAS